jgi:hypothetical protein
LDVLCCLGTSWYMGCTVSLRGWLSRPLGHNLKNSHIVN